MRILDWLPIGALASIAACGSFRHIADLAERSGQTGWMAYATAVCIDLLAVVASLEIRRDKRLGRKSTVPTLVLALAICLTLGANLAEAERTVWGLITAGVPAGAFLLAVFLIERRGGEVLRGAAKKPAELEGEVLLGVQKNPAELEGDLFPEPGNGQVSQVTDAGNLGPQDVPAGHDAFMDVQNRQEPVPEPVKQPPKALSELLILAQAADEEHRQVHSRPISRDALRAALRVSTGTASQVLKELRTA